MGSTRTLPRSILLAVAVLGLITFALGMYLEQTQQGWLAGHPITVNLLSSIVGFSTVTLVVGVGFNIVTERKARAPFEWRIAFAVRRHLGRIVQIGDYEKITKKWIYEATWTFKPLEILEFGEIKRMHDDYVRPYLEQFRTADHPGTLIALDGMIAAAESKSGFERATTLSAYFQTLADIIVNFKTWYRPL